MVDTRQTNFRKCPKEEPTTRRRTDDMKGKTRCVVEDQKKEARTPLLPHVCTYLRRLTLSSGKGMGQIILGRDCEGARSLFRYEL